MFSEDEKVILTRLWKSARASIPDALDVDTRDEMPQGSEFLVCCETSGQDDWKGFEIKLNRFILMLQNEAAEHHDFRLRLNDFHNPLHARIRGINDIPIFDNPPQEETAEEFADLQHAAREYQRTIEEFEKEIATAGIEISDLKTELAAQVELAEKLAAENIDLNERLKELERELKSGAHLSQMTWAGLIAYWDNKYASKENIDFVVAMAKSVIKAASSFFTILGMAAKKLKLPNLTRSADDALKQLPAPDEIIPPEPDNADDAISASPANAPPDFSSFKDDLSDGSKGPEMVVIPAGKFLMGSPDSDTDAVDAEKPQHAVAIERRFAIGRYPVTFEEYDYYCQEAGIETPDDNGWERGDRPVIHMRWNDVVAYTKWLNVEVSGKAETPYYLPSEAEWEYAARAGTETRYPWGDEWDKTKANGADGGPGKTSIAGDYAANDWGLYDMIGNVWEWVEDDLSEDYSTPRTQSPFKDSNSFNRVLRGGSWDYDPRHLRSASRDWFNPTVRNIYVGFRLSRMLALESLPL
ncbi:MAG: SUMF1/EgtB/PvdO family nonheme iron enzyme [Hyphomicrobiales bacterium]|nr:SUMF1/EgtB/PvdO family nonheme iron enzyme [Hyphomicrobiales bacterium]